MAFGRKQTDETPAAGFGEPVPQKEGQPIWEAATRAKAAGRNVFACSVVVAATSGLGFGGKGDRRVTNWDPSPLIEAIEGLGWRLDHIDHVWQQTQNATSSLAVNPIGGLTVAHLLFRAS